MDHKEILVPRPKFINVSFRSDLKFQTKRRINKNKIE